MATTDELSLRDDGDGCIVPVKAVPGASRDRIVGVLGDCLKITTSAPAEKGKANTGVAKTLAKALGVSPKDVELVSGPTNPRKEFRVVGLSAAEARARLVNRIK